MLGVHAELTKLMDKEELLEKPNDEIRKKADDLIKMNDLMIGREKRVMDLKAEVTVGSSVLV